ncbi:hypothetical protein, partial [Neisseria sicca]|uniref:hypothetical protein n=1 Tax=Neisseria sicca TaxID=490 RepID=UPI001649B636
YWPFSVRESCTSNANPPSSENCFCVLAKFATLVFRRPFYVSTVKQPRLALAAFFFEIADFVGVLQG